MRIRMCSVTDMWSLISQQDIGWKENQQSFGKLGCPLEESQVLVGEVLLSIARKEAMVMRKYRENSKG